jgi:hypothetical protein
MFIYHMENMISKVNVPLTGIDHFSLSPSKNYVAIGCESDRMIVIVDIRKCMVRVNAGKE